MDKELLLLVSGFAFAMGACIASFLNVVIWRVPRGESIVSPPSHCPKCGAAIRWYQNIPILSWLALRGKCANCKAPISPRYILVETLGGILFWLVFMRYASPGKTFGAANVVSVVVMWIWTALMIAGSFIDFDHKLLPDFTTVGGMLLGVAYHGVLSLMSFFSAADHSTIRLFDYSIVPSLAGLVFGFGLLWLVRFVGSIAFRREAMGMGDVFLMGAIGAMCGPVAVIFTLVLSSIVGSVAGVSLIALSKTKFGRFVEIPYGPYLCLGCFVWMLCGPQLVAAYLRMLLGQ